MTRPSCNRAASIALGALTALALLPASAWATTTVSYSASTGALIQGDSTGEGFDLHTTAPPSRLRVVPGAAGAAAIATLVAGNGCQFSGSSVECALTGNRTVTARLGDGRDAILTGGFEVVVDMFISGEGGDDFLRGGPGFDSISGGTGGDDMFGEAGDDLLQGGDGNDVFHGDQGGTDTMRGEGGNDTLRAIGISATDLFDGGTGVDVADYSLRGAPVTLKASLVSTPTPDDGAPGEGDDLDNVETLIGGSGNDTLEISNSFLARLAPRGTFTLRGNRGADTLRAVNQIRTFMDGGVGSDTVSGGSAADSIFSREGEVDTITCGRGIDTLKPDLRDPISPTCENLDQSDRREGPNVGFRTRSVAVDADGVLAVRLACPRSVRSGCRGALAARLDRRGKRFGGRERYSLRPGRRTTVEVALPAGQVARARRRGARVRVRSVERGRHGPKTTQRSLPARRD